MQKFPVRTLPVPAQNRASPGNTQLPPTNASQNVPALQLPAPGQHTPPAGAQVNSLGQRKNPGLPGQGGPDVAVRFVPGGMTMTVLGAIVIICTGARPAPAAGAGFAFRVASATQSSDTALSVACKIR